RHGIARAGRQAARRRRSSCDAAGTLRRPADRATRGWRIRAATVSLLRQRNDGGCGPGLRGAADRPNPSEALASVARMDGGPYPVSRDDGPARQRVPAVAVDVSYRAARPTPPP